MPTVFVSTCVVDTSATATEPLSRGRRVTNPNVEGLRVRTDSARSTTESRPVNVTLDGRELLVTSTPTTVPPCHVVRERALTASDSFHVTVLTLGLVEKPVILPTLASATHATQASAPTQTRDFSVTAPTLGSLEKPVMLLWTRVKATLA